MNLLDISLFIALEWIKQILSNPDKILSVKAEKSISSIKIFTYQFSHVCSWWVNDTAFCIMSLEYTNKKHEHQQNCIIFLSRYVLNEKLITLKVLKDLSLYHLHLKIVVGTLSANKHLNKHMRQTVVSNTLASFLSTSFRETFWDTLYVCIWYIYVKNVIDANGFFSIIMHFWKLTQNKLIYLDPPSKLICSYKQDVLKLFPIQLRADIYHITLFK